MKRILFIILAISNVALSKEKFQINTFIGHDLAGKAKIDKNDINYNYTDYSFNIKVTGAYEIYSSIYLMTSIQHETYYLKEYQKGYKLVPLTIGIRYLNENKKKLYRPYMSLAIGTSMVIDAKEVPIDKEVNGFGELDIGFFYDGKYMVELAYKHQAFKYKPLSNSNSELWNGQMIGVNFGYKF